MNQLEAQYVTFQLPRDGAWPPQHLCLILEIDLIHSKFVHITRTYKSLQSTKISFPNLVFHLIITLPSIFQKLPMESLQSKKNSSIQNPT